MRVMIDTNVLVSAILSMAGTPGKAYTLAVTSPNHGMICEQSITELRKVFLRKFPKKIEVLELFINLMSNSVEIVPVPTEEEAEEYKIRDISDRPILRAAFKANVDILLTGDRDFLEADIKSLKILTPAAFIKSWDK